MLKDIVTAPVPLPFTEYRPLHSAVYTYKPAALYNNLLESTDL